MKKNGIVFGGIFLTVGCTIFYFAVLSKLIDAARMQFWQSTKAQVISADVNSYMSRNDDGDDVKMYRFDLQYQYTLQGQNYFGSRAQISGGASSDRTRAYQLNSQVKYDRKYSNGITIWYNPNNKNQSIFDRTLDIRFLLIMTCFSGIFALVGGGIMRFYWQPKVIPPEGSDPNKPWTTRTEWASPIIYSNAQTKVKLAWYFALAAFCFFGTFSISMFGKNIIGTVFSVIFLLVPIWLSVRAYRLNKEWKFFSKVPLTLKALPGVIGGGIGGSLIIPKEKNSVDTYTATLNCTHYKTTRSGNSSQTKQTTVFSNKQSLQALNSHNGTKISFDFDVPADRPISSIPSNNYHRWTINIEGKFAGTNFNREYEVPMFITKESMSVADELKETPLTAKEVSELNDKLDLNTEVTHSNNITNLASANETGRRDQVNFNTQGSKESLLFVAMGLFFFTLGLFLALQQGAMMGYAFCAFSSLFIAIGIWSFGKNCKVRVSDNKLDVDIHFLSKLVRQHSFNSDSLKGVQVVAASTTQSSSGTAKEKFSLHLHTHTHRTIDIGGSFSSHKKALHLKQQIECAFFGEIQPEEELY